MKGQYKRETKDESEYGSTGRPKGATPQRRGRCVSIGGFEWI